MSKMKEEIKVWIGLVLVSVFSSRGSQWIMFKLTNQRTEVKSAPRNMSNTIKKNI